MVTNGLNECFWSSFTQQEDGWRLQTEESDRILVEALPQAAGWRNEGGGGLGLSELLRAIAFAPESDWDIFPEREQVPMVQVNIIERIVFHDTHDWEHSLVRRGMDGVIAGYFTCYEGTSFDLLEEGRLMAELVHQKGCVEMSDEPGRPEWAPFLVIGTFFLRGEELEVFPAPPAPGWWQAVERVRATYYRRRAEDEAELELEHKLRELVELLGYQRVNDALEQLRPS